MDGAQGAVTVPKLSYVPSPKHQVPSMRPVTTMAMEGILKASSCLVKCSVHAGMARSAFQMMAHVVQAASELSEAAWDHKTHQSILTAHLGLRQSVGRDS